MKNWKVGKIKSYRNLMCLVSVFMLQLIGISGDGLLRIKFLGDKNSFFDEVMFQDV